MSDDLNLSKAAPKKPAAKNPAVKASKTETPKRGTPLTLNHPMGVLARDRVSGYTGIVIGRIAMLAGNVQYGLQPEGEKDKYNDGHYIDYHLLEEIGDGFCDDLPERDPTVTIKLGDKVKDTISGLKGIAVEEIMFQNGCVYFCIAPFNALNALGEATSISRFPHQRLVPYRSLGDRLKALFTPAPKPDKEPRTKRYKSTFFPAAEPTGGPSRSMSSIGGSSRISQR